VSCALSRLPVSLPHCLHRCPADCGALLCLQVDDALTVREARLIAEGARNAIVSAVPDVAMADIHLDLLESSPQSMYDEYNSANELTASKGVELELRGPLRANDPGETLAS